MTLAAIGIMEKITSGTKSFFLPEGYKAFSIVLQKWQILEKKYQIYHFSGVGVMNASITCWLNKH
jgi:hypothetical protein